jgi:hypothetical protein
MTYQEIAYKKLGLSMEGHEIGTMRYIDLPENALHAICIRRLNTLISKLFEDRPPATEDNTWCRNVRINFFLLYPRWLYILKTKSYEPKSWRDTTLDHEERRDAIVECHFKYDLDKGGKYEPTFDGWKKYLREASPHFYRFLNETPVAVKIAERIREEHTYLCGSTGTGKTELLKLFIHSYIRNAPRTSLVIIGPTAKLSDEVAKWPENVGSNRIIYVTFERDSGLAPCINPFEISGLDPADTSARAIGIKWAVAQELLEALAEVIRADGDMEFTVNMRATLQACVLVLLDREGATLHDLLVLLNDHENDKLVAFAATRTHYPNASKFFQTKFKAKESGITSTKNALYSKLFSIMEGGALPAVTCGKSTIDLEREVNAGKILIFNLSKNRFGPIHGAHFGRLIVAMLKAIAMRREELLEKKIDPVPCHVFIDECQNYISASIDTIMREARKYKVILTLAQTEIGAGMPTATKDAVLGGTNIKIAGAAQPSEWGNVARMLRVEEQEIAQLRKGDFFIRPGRGTQPFRFKDHEHLLNDRHSMSERQWQRFYADQLERYYRPISRPISEITPVAKEPETPPAKREAPPEIHPPVKRNAGPKAPVSVGAEIEEDVI